MDIFLWRQLQRDTERERRLQDDDGAGNADFEIFVLAGLRASRSQEEVRDHEAESNGSDEMFRCDSLVCP